MKKPQLVFGSLFACTAASGVLIGAFGWLQEWPFTATVFLIVPLVGSVLVATVTVYEHGTPEQEREVAAALVIYILLGCFTAAAYATGVSTVREKFVDAFLFGQVVALLSVLKLCLSAWGNPTRRETHEERSVRLDAARRIRRANTRKGPQTPS